MSKSIRNVKAAKGKGLSASNEPARTSASSTWSVPRSRRPGRVVKSHSILDVIDELSAGLPFERLDQFLSESGLPRQALLDALQIPARTLARRRRSGRFSPEESERLHRLAVLFEQAVTLHGDVERASRWMVRPARAFAGITPLAMARSETGAREVEKLIGQIEHGVFT